MTYNLFVIGVNILGSILGCAIAILLTFQLRRDPKSRTFLALAALQSVNGASFALARIFGIISPPDFLPFFYVGILIYPFYPGLLLRFTVEYFELRTPLNKWLTRAMLLLPVLAMLGAITDRLFYSVSLRPTGSFDYPPTPYTIVLIALAELCSLYTFSLVLRHATAVKWQAHRQLVFGLLIQVGVTLLFPFGNVFRMFAAVLILFGTVLIMGSVLRFRLFDPLTALNRKLLRRTRKLRRAMRRNEMLLEEVKQANAAKTRFISYISHEVRNPIANIYTASEEITGHEYLFEEPLPAAYKEELARISRQARHLRALIDDLLDLGKIEAGALHLSRNAVNPVNILDEVQQATSAQLQPGVKMIPCYPRQLPDVDADQTRLQQILINILSNAAKFTQHGSITLNAQVEAPMLRFTVSDTGRGMSDAMLERLFQPYSQDVRDLEKPRGGTGLGLVITRYLVELHGGTVQVQSKLDEGTTVSFTLPVAAGSTSSSETRE